MQKANVTVQVDVSVVCLYFAQFTNFAEVKGVICLIAPFSSLVSKLIINTLKGIRWYIEDSTFYHMNYIVDM